MTATSTTATTDDRWPALLSCLTRALERDTADDDHDVGRGVDTDPPGQQTPSPTTGPRLVRGSSTALMPFLHRPSSASIRPDRTAFTNSWKSCSF